MINSHHTIGIVLKRNNYGEADRLVVVFTEKFGKITLIAKGVRRLKSKIAGSIELFSISDLTVSKGKNLFVLTASSMIKPFKPHQDLAEIKLASLISEIIIKTIPDESPNNKVFNLLYESFSAFGLGLKLNILSSYLFAHRPYSNRPCPPPLKDIFPAVLPVNVCRL